jgi:hypothetical protein
MPSYRLVVDDGDSHRSTTVEALAAEEAEERQQESFLACVIDNACPSRRALARYRGIHREETEVLTTPWMKK